MSSFDVYGECVSHLSMSQRAGPGPIYYVSWPKGSRLIRQLNFLHHVLKLESSDPVFLMLNELRKFTSEKNWANDILELFDQYDIALDDGEIRSMSKRAWKKWIKAKVRAVAFRTLVDECSNMKKTKQLRYETFCCQPYLTTMSPCDAGILFRARLHSINCKANMPGASQDRSCRLCGESAETQEHIINCWHVKGDKELLDLTHVYDAEADPGILRELCRRLRRFEELRAELT